MRRITVYDVITRRFASRELKGSCTRFVWLGLHVARGVSVGVE
jgi:hypothetical protein